MPKIRYFSKINPETAFDLYVSYPEWYADWERRMRHAIRTKYLD